MAEAVVVVLLAVAVYLFASLTIAFIHALFSDRKQRKENFKRTFYTFYLEILNPFNWF